MIHTMGEMQARVTQIVTFLDALGRAESQLGAAPDVDMEGAAALRSSITA